MNEREKGDFLIPVRTPVRTHVPGPKAPWPLCQIISKPHLIIKQLCVLDASDIKDLGCRALANSFIDPVSFLSALFQPIFWHLTSWWGPHSTLVCYNLQTIVFIFSMTVTIITAVFLEHLACASRVWLSLTPHNAIMGGKSHLCFLSFFLMIYFLYHVQWYYFAYVYVCVRVSDPWNWSYRLLCRQYIDSL